MDREESLNHIIEEGRELAIRMINTNFEPIKDIKLIPKKCGVYIIKEIKPLKFEGKIFYIGSSKDLNRRINRHFYVDSNLRDKLSGLIGADKIIDYLSNNCEFVIKEFGDSDTAELVEHILISTLRVNEHLLNDHKVKRSLVTPSTKTSPATDPLCSY